jgi:hypothetical protein
VKPACRLSLYFRTLRDIINSSLSVRQSCHSELHYFTNIKLIYMHVCLKMILCSHLDDMTYVVIINLLLIVVQIVSHLNESWSSYLFCSFKLAFLSPGHSIGMVS